MALLVAATACLVAGPRFAARGLVPPPAARTPPRRRARRRAGRRDVIVPPRGDAVLVDAGGLAGTTFDIGTRVLMPALRALGIARLHALVLTHGDPDHVGGAEVMLERLRPAQRVGRRSRAAAPCPAAAAPARGATTDRLADRASRRRRARRAGARFECCIRLRPDWERQRVRNDDSVVLEVRYRDVSILLPGDIGREVEEALIPGAAARPLVILKAAHHGSATSSSEEFIEATRPAAVIFSAGKNNRFGHPARSVVERFKRAGVEMFNTAHDGAVFVETDGKRVEVRGWRAEESTSYERAAVKHDDSKTRRHYAH